MNNASDNNDESVNHNSPNYDEVDDLGREEWIKDFAVEEMKEKRRRDPYDKTGWFANMLKFCRTVEF